MIKTVKSRKVVQKDGALFLGCSMLTSGLLAEVIPPG